MEPMQVALMTKSNSKLAQDFAAAAQKAAKET
jgi:hypothetical protein